MGPIDESLLIKILAHWNFLIDMLAAFGQALPPQSGSVQATLTARDPVTPDAAE